MSFKLNSMTHLISSAEQKITLITVRFFCIGKSKILIICYAIFM